MLPSLSTTCNMLSKTLAANAHCYQVCQVTACRSQTHKNSLYKRGLYSSCICRLTRRAAHLNMIDSATAVTVFQANTI